MSRWKWLKYKVCMYDSSGSYTFISCRLTILTDLKLNYSYLSLTKQYEVNTIEHSNKTFKIAD